MHIKRSTVNAFLKQIVKAKTAEAYRATLDNFSDYCGGHIETDRTDEFLEYRRDLGRAEKTVACDRSIINCLKRYAAEGVHTQNIGRKKPVTAKKATPAKKPEPKTDNDDPIIAAFGKCDEKALAFAATKLTEAYNTACETVKKSAVPVKWDAASWDEAAERAKAQYEGLRRFRDVLNLVNTMWEVKAGVKA